MSNPRNLSYWYITTIVLTLAVGCFSPQQSKHSSPSETAAVTPASKASPVPALQSDSFRQAVNYAMKASTLSQSAKSKTDWDSVVSNWQNATDLMKAVPNSSPHYATAQKKVEEYKKI